MVKREKKVKKVVVVGMKVLIREVMRDRVTYTEGMKVLVTF